MKVGIVTSGFEMLGLFKFLHKYDLEYHIYWDWNNWPYGDKGYEHSKKLVEIGVQELEKLKVDYILVPPAYELDLIEGNKKILPLFKQYILDYSLKYSLVGKIGFIGDYSDCQVIEKQFKSLKEGYNLTESQNNIKKFNKNFPVWVKETTLWKYYLLKLGARDPMVRKTIKFDMKYFKDAGIDTLIPLNWSYFMYENVIQSKINKIRFHGYQKAEKLFVDLIDYEKNKGKYDVKFHANGTLDLLKNQKKWFWMLQRGKEINIK